MIEEELWRLLDVQRAKTASSAWQQPIDVEVAAN